MQSRWLFIILFLSCSCWNKQGDTSAVGEDRVWVSKARAGPCVLDIGTMAVGWDGAIPTTAHNKLNLRSKGCLLGADGLLCCALAISKLPRLSCNLEKMWGLVKAKQGAAGVETSIRHGYWEKFVLIPCNATTTPGVPSACSASFQAPSWAVVWQGWELPICCPAGSQAQCEPLQCQGHAPRVL